MARLMHYSSKPITAVYSVAQDMRRPDKPNGLWVSVEGKDDWKEWCEAESFGIGTVAHEVRLSPSANILRVECGADLEELHRDWGFEPYPHGCGVLWNGLAEKYDGIIIAPYLWPYRLHDRIRWYYSWDCASGCIWSAEAVAAIQEAK